MKWTEKGISFEGTVEEFKALHDMRPALLLPEPREEGPQESEPERRILKKRERTGLVVEVTQRDGSSIVLPSMSAAFRWYVGERGEQRKITCASAFRSRLGYEKAIYTEGLIFSLVEEEAAILNNTAKGENESAN